MTFEIENVYPEVVLPDYETVIKNVIEAALDYENVRMKHRYMCS